MKKVCRIAVLVFSLAVSVSHSQVSTAVTDGGGPVQVCNPFTDPNCLPPG